MNSLSWILYLADAADKIGTVAATVTIIGGIATMVLLLIYVVSSGFAASGEEDARKFASFIGPILKCFAVAVGAFGLLYAVTPSASTLYLIAASEVGETVVTAPGTTELVGDLTAIIKKRLKEELAE